VDSSSKFLLLTPRYFRAAPSGPIAPVRARGRTPPALRNRASRTAKACTGGDSWRAIGTPTARNAPLGRSATTFPSTRPAPPTAPARCDSQQLCCACSTAALCLLNGCFVPARRLPVLADTATCHAHSAPETDTCPSTHTGQPDCKTAGHQTDDGTWQGACSGDWTGGQIVDTVLVPQDITPGEYVLGWRCAEIFVAHV